MSVNEQINCIIDCRVSDPVQLKGGSLDNQETLGRLYAKNNGWNVVRVFRKPHSGATTERSDIEEIIQFIKHSEFKIHFFIFKSIDRFTRAGYPEYERCKNRFANLGVELVDTYGIIQPKKNTLAHLGNFGYDWAETSPTEAAEMLASYSGKQERRDILLRLIGGEISLVQEGFAVRRAPDGMQNKKILTGHKERYIRVPDPERAHYFIMMFELRAHGLDDKEIVARINAMGFQTRTFRRWDRSNAENPKVTGQKGGQKLTVKRLQRYMLQTEYAGIICEKWTHYKPIRARYDGLVSLETFNLANRGKIFIKENPDNSLQLLYDYSQYDKIQTKRLKNNPDYPLKFILCSTCRKPFLGSRSRGKSGKLYAAYHCGGNKIGNRTHPYIRIPKTEFEEAIRQFLELLHFDQSFLNSFEAVFMDTYRKREKEIVNQSSLISHNVGALKAQQASDLEALTTTKSAVVRKMLEEKIEDLDYQIQQAQNQRDEIEITEQDIKSFIRFAKTIMEHPAENLLDIDDMRAQQTLFNLIFAGMPTYQEILNGTPKLSLVFKLSGDSNATNSQLVAPTGVEPVLPP